MGDQATSTRPPDEPPIDRVGPEIHAFRAETHGRFEVVHRDFDQLRGEMREELEAMRQAIARGYIAIVVVLVLGFVVVAALLAVRA